MNVKPCLRAVQRFQRKIDAAFQQFRRFRQKIVVRRIPQHADSVRLRERSVIELDLHVEHVGHTGLRQFFHVPRIPYPTAQRNSFRDPGHVHAAFRSPSRPNPQSASDDYSDSTSPFPSPSLSWMVPLNRKRARFASRPSEFFFFSTLKFRISNQTGVYRQLFDIYFCLRLSHLGRNCNSYPLDKFCALPRLTVIFPSNHRQAGSARAGPAHPGGIARPSAGYIPAAAPPRVLCIPPEHSWPAAFCRSRSTSRSLVPCRPQRSRRLQSFSSCTT